MTNKKISALASAATPLAGSELVPIVQSSVTNSVSVANLTAGRAVSAASVTTTGVITTGGGLISDDGTYGRWTITQASGGNQLFSTTTGFGGWRTGSIQANGTGANMTWGSDGNTTVGVGNLIQGTAAKGINFTANTPAAGMTSQLLNWYEEGLWTPNQGAGIVLVGAFSSSGAYTRIGRQVTLTGKLQGSTSIANVTNGGTFFTNPPFAPSSNSVGVLINDAQNQTGSGVLATNSVFYITPMSATPIIYFTITYFV
jgi:hypothetical protein